MVRTARLIAVRAIFALYNGKKLFGIFLSLTNRVSKRKCQELCANLFAGSVNDTHIPPSPAEPPKPLPRSGFSSHSSHTSRMPKPTTMPSDSSWQTMDRSLTHTPESAHGKRLQGGSPRKFRPIMRPGKSPSQPAMPP